MPQDPQTPLAETRSSAPAGTPTPEHAEFRRDLHRHPETGFDLERTPARVAERLEAAGLEVVRGVGRSGLVATLRGRDDDAAVGLRADMDALPITEANEFAHRSTVEGKFHGCGHDGHTTMLMAAALDLARGPEPTRTIRFIFQPDEENGRGARAMIADGLFERFPVQAIYGLHNLPGLPVGRFATHAGPFCTFEENFEIRLRGRGGHASMPEAGVDAIVVGSAIVTQLQTIASRSVSGGDHAVVSVTGFETDGARNILAGNVTLSGDCRGFSEDVSTRIKARMRAVVEGCARAHGAEVEMTYERSFSPLVNDPACTDRAAEAAATVGQVDTSFGRVGFSEDFAAFLEHRPGAFILTGNGVEGANAMPLHNPGYDFNDAAIPSGVAFWRALAVVG